MNFVGFLKEFIICPTKTGAIAPSSTRLSELITDVANLSNANFIVEFGPGTGVFTEKILQKMPSGAFFIAIESNEKFVTTTQQRCPNVTVYHDNARNAKLYMDRHGIKQCDCVISGLPWAAFNPDLQEELLSTILEILKPGGRFVTFAYLQGLILPSGVNFRKKIYSHFQKVTITKPVWRNTPPALVYSAQK